MTILHAAFKKAADDAAHRALLRRSVQEPWYRDPAGYRAWAEDYYVTIKPTPEQGGTDQVLSLVAMTESGDFSARRACLTPGNCKYRAST